MFYCIKLPRNHGPTELSSNPPIRPKVLLISPSSSLRRKRLRAHRLSTLSTRPVGTSLSLATNPLLPLQLSGTSFKVSPYRPSLALNGSISRLGGLAMLEVALDASAALCLVAVGLGARLSLRGLAELRGVVDGAGCRAGEAAQGVCLCRRNAVLRLPWHPCLRVGLEGVLAGSCSGGVRLRAELRGGIVADLDSWLVLLEERVRLVIRSVEKLPESKGWNLLLHV